MARVARTEPGTTINVGESVFEFGDDGTRRVTAAEEELLTRHIDREGLPARIEFEDERTKSERSK